MKLTGLSAKQVETWREYFDANPPRSVMEEDSRGFQGPNDYDSSRCPGCSGRSLLPR